MEKDGTQIVLKCDLCGTTEQLQRCGFCKSAFYCSRDHQMKDWKRHKETCKKIKAGNSHLTTTVKDDLDLKDTQKAVQNVNSGEKTPDENSGIEPSKIDCQSEHRDNAISVRENEGHGDDEGIPFDERKYQPCKTLTLPQRMRPDQIGKHVVKHLLRDGFCILDNLFEDIDIENAIENIHACDRLGMFNFGRLAGGKTCDDADQQVVNSGIRSDKIMWVEGVEEYIPGINKIVSLMDDVLATFNLFLGGRYNIYKRTKAMIACYPGNGSYYKRHIDNPSGDGRVVTCILYLNKNWSAEEDGGFLRILPLDSDNYTDVAPLANRMLFFWSDRRNPHEVHPAYRNRYAITVWYFDKDEREKAKQETNNNATLPTTKDYSLHNCKSLQDTQTNVKSQIEDVATSAISSLSIEELQDVRHIMKAISAVIKDEANPQAILTSMGISAAIQEKLLEKLCTL